MGRALSRKGRQCHRRQRSVQIELEETAIYGEDHQKRQYRDKQATQQRYQPQGNTGEEAHILDSSRHLRRQRHGCTVDTAHTAGSGGDDTGADRENVHHQVDAVGNSQLRHDKVDKMPQDVFRPLKIPETGTAAKDANSQKQHQQTVTNALHSSVDGLDRLPYRAALERLRRLGQQRPHLR